MILEGPCTVQESLRGYQAALPRSGRWFFPNKSLPRRNVVVILPSVGIVRPQFARMLLELVKDGATGIIESGAGFVGHLEFRQHRQSLRERLGIHVTAPVTLWSRESKQRPPYIEFTWPRRLYVRDFSRVVPPAAQEGDIIAIVGDLPVALKRRIGAGMLIYLGSLLGPALWSGDVQARRWLYDVAFGA